ncbi:MAG: hypothetical protein JW989_00605 [Chlorobiaceae bacterium]|nr:hypothetical protein [Chlorobiaceae bacterium]
MQQTDLMYRQLISRNNENTKQYPAEMIARLECVAAASIFHDKKYPLSPEFFSEGIDNKLSSEVIAAGV